MSTAASSASLVAGEKRSLRHRALVATFVIWAAVTALQLVAYKLTGLPIGPAGWISVATTFPLVLMIGWTLFECAWRTADRSEPHRYAALGAVLVGAAALIGPFDAVKDVWLMDLLDPQPHRPIASMMLAGFVYHLLLFGILATLFEAWIEGASRVAQARDLAAAREAEAQARLVATQAEAAAVEARLTALRYQLNPHFLFNTLNAISSMVVTGRNEAAEGMLERLCDFLRATLAGKPDRLVPLEDELATIASYLEIESFRLRDRLVVEFCCPAALTGALVPGFLLQPLVENAVKHGVGRTSRRVRLEIAVSAELGEKLEIAIIDDAMPDLATEPAAKGLGVGLANVEERLQSVFGDDAKLETERLAPGFAVRLNLPLMFQSRAHAA